MAIYQYTKDVNPAKLQREIAAASISSVLSVSTIGTGVSVSTSIDLTQEQQEALESTISAHVPTTTSESVSRYLSDKVYPFVHQLLCDMAAGSIAMGITQAGKTGHVLSLFTKYYPVPTAQYQNSLKGSLDTGSLYIAMDIIQYIRDNPSEYDGLSPFITDSRLSKMKDDIQAFLTGP